ncbi:MAG: hypothetical protein WCK51_12275 [Armatimonadota bacterium]
MKKMVTADELVPRTRSTSPWLVSTRANRHGENTVLAYDALGRAWRKFLNNGLYEE